MNSTKGDGPYTHGNSHANGNSFANGSPVPAWLRLNWEYAEVRASQYSSWTVMA